MKPAFWGWPGWPVLRLALWLGLAVSLEWIVVYGGTNLLTASHSYRVRLHLDAERAMPFVPASVLVYMSIYLLFWVSPFVLRTPRELRALTATLAVVILTGGVCFLLFPGEAVFPAQQESTVWRPFVGFAKTLALEHNFAPSMHVALSTVCILLYARRASRPGKWALWSWSLAVNLSTLLLHQHYLLDVFTGQWLAFLAVGAVFERLCPAATVPASPASPCSDPAPPA